MATENNLSIILVSQILYQAPKAVKWALPQFKLQMRPRKKEKEKERLVQDL